MTHLEISFSASDDHVAAESAADLVIASAKLQHLAVDFLQVLHGSIMLQQTFFERLNWSEDPDHPRGWDDDEDDDKIVRRLCKDLRSLHFSASSFGSSEFDFFYFLSTFPIVDLAVNVTDYDVPDMRRFAEPSQIRRLYLNAAGLLRSEQIGAREGSLSQATHIEEFWSTECRKMEWGPTLVRDDALPPRPRKLVLCCPVNEMVKYQSHGIRRTAGYPHIIQFASKKAGVEHSTEEMTVDDAAGRPSCADWLQKTCEKSGTTILPVDWRAGLVERINHNFDSARRDDLPNTAAAE